MFATEKLVREGSDFYVYTASTSAKRLFLYPMIVGYFRYEPGYHLSRQAFDSFLIMYVRNGECTIETDGRQYHASAGSVVLMDCYRPHAYWTSTGWDAEWIHFDGANARGYYEMITQYSGNVLSLRDTYRFEKYLHKIYVGFRDSMSTREPLLNNYLVDILTELLLAKGQDTAAVPTGEIIDDTVAYITDHLQEELSLQQLADQASLSAFYFSRLFKKETGFSPHEYVIEARVNAAKYFLQSSRMSIKDVCFSCGFTSESSFCTTFKKVVGITPSQYRSTASVEHPEDV